MKRFVTTIAVALMAVPMAASRVEIVLDVSGSMRAPAGNMTRMDAARNAVRATVEAIDPNSNVALRLYGHRLPSEPKEASCRDTQLVIPFGRLDRERFIAAINSARPLGQTPLAYSLEQASTDFASIGDEPAAVILVSDGEESCGGDPARVACAFRERGLELTVHTVGFDVNDVARKQLQAVANCTGGEYRDARNAGELAESLRQLTQAGLLIEKQRDAGTGREVRGGNGLGTATRLAPGQYRLDHHQRPNEYDYFAVDVKPGYLLRVSQQAHEVGVTIDGSSLTENNYPTVGVALHGPDRGRIVEDAKVGAGAKVIVGTSVPAGRGGTYYVLIGQKYWDRWAIHKESPFTIELVDATDAGSGTDAGSKENEAIPMKPGAHKAWIQPGDQHDMYWFQGAAGATYQMWARPDGQAHGLSLTVTDEDGVMIANAVAPNSGAVVRLEEIRPSRSGKLFAMLSSVAPHEPIAYTVELKAASGGSIAATPASDDDAQTEGSESVERRSPLSYIPGGGCTCAAVLALLLVAGVVVIIAVVMLLRRRRPRQ